MFNYTLDKEDIEKLNFIIEDKNDLSILNRFESLEASDEELGYLKELGIVDEDNVISQSSTSIIDTLANPQAIASIVFTGGVSTYEHCINYNTLLENPVSFTIAPNKISIQNNEELSTVIETMEAFIGRSNLKSITYSKTYNIHETYVIAVLLDLERKAILRAFIDEIPYSNNSYNVNMIWRILNSTSSSIQWFVHIIMNMIGEEAIITQSQVSAALHSLAAKGDIVQKNNVYQPSQELTLLANRMVVVDNVMAVQSCVKQENDEVLNAGFTCVQSGVHDLLFLDFNGSDIILETISSSRLLDYLKNFIDGDALLNHKQK